MDGQKHGGHGMRVTFRKSRTAGFLDVTIYRVRCDGEDIASIQAKGDKWFWYGMGRNTASTPVSLEAAKEQVRDRIKELRQA